MLIKISTKLWTVLMVITVIAGIVVSIGRIASPYLSHFKTDIEAEASLLIGSQVKIGQIKALWHGLGPALILKDIEISNNKHMPPLLLSRVDLDLSLKHFFTTGTFLPWNVVLHGINLQLLRDRYKQLHIMGINNSHDENNDSTAIVTALLNMHRIQLIDSNIQWTDLSNDTPNASVQKINLLLRNDDDRHQLDLSFHLSQDLNQSFELKADIKTSKESLKQWHGKFFIKTKHFEASDWVNHLLPPQYRLTSGLVNSHLWFNASHKGVQNISGDVQANHVVLSTNQHHQTLILNQLQSDFQWQTNHHQWQLDASNTTLSVNQQVWPEIDFSIKQTDSKQLSLGISYLDTTLLTALKPFLPEPIATKIETFNLKGLIKKAHAHFQQDFSDGYFEAELEQLSLHPIRSKKQKIQLPGFKNISAKVMASPQKGLLKIDTTDGEYLHTGLFRQPISLTQLQGDLFWKKLPNQHWALFSHSLKAITPQISTTSRLYIDVPKTDGLTVDIQTDFKEGNAAQAGLYYPVGIMNDHLVEWLDNSVVSGHVSSGSFLLKGPLDHFPFDKTHDGHFEVLFNTDNLILDYLDQWPRLEQSTAQVRFHNNSLGIQLSHANLLHSKVHQASAHIHSLDPLTPIKITGQISGPATDAFKILSETPLKKDFKHITSTMSINGNTTIDLALEIPLDEIGTQQVNGNIYFQNNKIQLTDLPLSLDQITGQLNFNLDGLSSKNLHATLFDKNCAIHFSHDNVGTTHINTSIKLKADQIQKFQPSFPNDIISGVTDWKLSLSLPPLSKQKTEPVTLKLSSDLKGIKITAPKPLEKPASQSRPFSLVTTIGDSPLLPIQFNYGEKVQARFEIDRSTDPFKLKAGNIHFGDKPTFKKTLKDLSINGYIKHIDLNQWLNFKNIFPTNSQKSLPILFNLKSKQLSYKNLLFNDFNIQAKRQDKTLQGTISSRELAGRFTIPNVDTFQQLDVDLDHASIDLNLDTMGQGTSQTTFNSFNPVSAPDLKINVKQLSFNQHKFGQASFISHRGNKSMVLDHFSLDGKLLNIEASGLWSKNHQKQKSSLDFNFNSSNFGTVLQQLGYSPQIAKGTAKIEGHIWWFGGPPEFNQETLSGKLNIQIQDGRFVEIEPGVGRVLGILNVAALQRRLTLDFTDLFKEGFTFDEISANFSLDQGDAYTNNLFIKSPSAKINLSGRTGIKTRDYDQLVTVTPSLKSSLTLAGAIGAGPAGAAIGYIAQKLIGDQVDKLGRTQYIITGSWDDPTIKELKKNPQKNKGNNNDPLENL